MGRLAYRLVSSAELSAWVDRAPRVPDTIFVVHGEPAASASLAATLSEVPGRIAVVPRYGERVRLDRLT